MPDTGRRSSSPCPEYGRGADSCVVVAMRHFLSWVEEFGHAKRRGAPARAKLTRRPACEKPSTQEVRVLWGRRSTHAPGPCPRGGAARKPFSRGVSPL